MFKPVTGADLREFDEETRNLYAKRQTDTRITGNLLAMPRITRNYLPVVASPDHPYMKDKEAYIANYPLKIAASCSFFTFACWQFTKAYYPYGIILRNSIPTTPMKQLSYKAPIILVFLALWYKEREMPRQKLMDLTSDTE